MEQPLILNRYRALEVLGEGGHGVVVLAYDTRIQRRVAIKRFPLTTAGVRGAGVPAGLAEARTAALLNHPNIVTVHEWDTDADEAFIIMEYVDGATVADLMSVADGPFTLDEAAAVVEAVAEALEYAHDNGVLHLDLKPENVFVMRDGRVKVGDFGIAALSSATGGSRGSGGTPGYMPPEQARGDELDERTDVWAFALLAYEMLTAANPFFAGTWEGAVFKAQVVDAPAPSEFEADLPSALDDILLAALSPEPAERYAGVRSLSNRLLGSLGDPREGRRSLAELVALACEEAPCDAYGTVSAGLWDRLARWSPHVTGALSGVVAAWLAWAGLAPFAPGATATLAAAGLLAAAAAVAPGLGLGVATLLFAAGLAWQGAPLAAAALIALAVPCWWLFGRRGGAWLAAYAGAGLGVAGVAPAAPLLAGFVLPPLPAAALSALSALIAMGASAASNRQGVLAAPTVDFVTGPWEQAGGALAFEQLATSWAPVAVMGGWAAAAALVSLCCRPASRRVALVGVALGVSALTGGYALAAVAADAVNASVTWMNGALLQSVAASSILMVLVVVAGPPIRAEEEQSSADRDFGT